MTILQCAVWHHSCTERGRKCSTRVYRPRNEALFCELVSYCGEIAALLASHLMRSESWREWDLVVGDGAQGMSWIHETDLNRLFERTLTNSTMQGNHIASSPYLPVLTLLWEHRRELSL